MTHRILIVDDEPNIVTHVARNGEEALAAVETFRPDLLLLDVNMPMVDGYEVAQRLRDAGWNQLRIVMLTAKGREAEVAKGMAVGADLYVTKPFSTRDLVDQVAQLLGPAEAAQ
jgi:DNA-binding response OmpR family regulator